MSVAEKKEYKKRNQGRGFTLIELLVVISIVGLLSTLALTAVKNAQMKSRDARRKADMKQIQTALNLYYDTYGTFPTTSSYGESVATGCCSGGWDCSCADQDGDGIYFMDFLQSTGIMPQVPVDPINDATHRYFYYYYTSSGNGCVAPYYVLAALGFEKDVVNYDTVCYTSLVSGANLVIVGGPNQ
jgi:prepilin-type N-terminal cleavage/methylation domain-containing protein